MVLHVQKKNLKLVIAGAFVFFATLFQGALLQPALAVDAKTCTSEGKVPLAIKINGQDCIARDQIVMTWVKAILQFLATGVGIAVVGGVIWGGLLYMTARDSSAQTEKAVMVIINSVLGLILFIFTYAIINFIIPGGILG